MELLNAQWRIGEGRTVDLRLAGTGFDRVHPFKRFQKRRGGRVGTRFKIACADTRSGEVFFKGEVMFAGWHDTSTQGQTVKFWLDDEATSHPFNGFTARGRETPGSVFAVVLVELGDDDQPVNQVAEKKLAGAHGRIAKALSSQAHLMITSEMFVQYLRESNLVKLKPGVQLIPDVAKRWVKHKLQIEHLSDLDRDPEKARMFHEHIRRPYARWNGEDC